MVGPPDNKTVFRINTGTDEADFSGMVKDYDPGAIPDTGFTHMENVYFHPGFISDRAGQAKVNSVAEDGCIDGLFDAGDTGAPDLDVPTALYLIALTGSGTTFYRLEGTAAEGLALGATHPTVFATTADSYGRYGFRSDTYIVFDSASCSRISDGAEQFVDPDDYGMNALQSADGSTDLFVRTGARGRISRWDGASFTLENAGDDHSNGNLLGLAGETLCWVYFFNPEFTQQNNLFVRTGPATSDTLAIPSSTYFSPSARVEYGGRLYYIGLEDGEAGFGTAGSPVTFNIISTDGGSVSLDHQVSAESALAMFVHGGVLYYVLNNEDSLVLGSFNGTVWNDTAKDLTADLSYADQYPLPEGAATDDEGRLLMYFRHALAGGGSVWGPPGAGVSGTWTQLLDVSANTDFDTAVLFESGVSGRFIRLAVSA